MSAPLASGPLAVPPVSRTLKVKNGALELLLLAFGAGVNVTWPALMLAAGMARPAVTGVPLLDSVPEAGATTTSTSLKLLGDGLSRASKKPKSAIVST